jgi:hypothetical protein
MYFLVAALSLLVSWFPIRVKMQILFRFILKKKQFCRKSKQLLLNKLERSPLLDTFTLV